MSSETYGWLAKNVLAGFAKIRRPWWATLSEAEGHKPQLFDGAIPIERVEKLLTSWQPVVTPLTATLPSGKVITVGSHKLVTASDDDSQLGVVGIDSADCTYADWLVGTVRECVKPSELEISSAGMLKNRSQAWIQIERPDTAVGPDGIKFSPHVTLSMALDNSLANQINQNQQFTICDNTLRITRDQGIAFKKTSGANSKLGVYREVMLAIMRGENDFKATLESLLADEVSNRRFSKFLDSFLPVNDDDTPAKKSRSNRVRQEITHLYQYDERVAPWRGTGLGVVQAVNTWETHMSQLRNATDIELSDTDLRAMRNYAQNLTPVKGETADQKTMRILASV
jgi:phage/plasmid-like protein (TIGR03299 family)